MSIVDAKKKLWNFLGKFIKQSEVYFITQSHTKMVFKKCEYIDTEVILLLLFSSPTYHRRLSSLLKVDLSSSVYFFFGEEYKWKETSQGQN